MAAKTGHGDAGAASRHVTELNWKCSVFLERLTAVFVKKAVSLQLLEPAEGSGAAEQAAPAGVGFEQRTS
jgi:hypothetical protein